jgi:hypothetical protein
MPRALSTSKQALVCPHTSSSVPVCKYLFTSKLPRYMQAHDRCVKGVSGVSGVSGVCSGMELLASFGWHSHDITVHQVPLSLSLSLSLSPSAGTPTT